MFKKILIAFDGSPGATRALDAAIELARVHGAQLSALAVEERLPHFAATLDEAVEEKDHANHVYRGHLEAARARAASASVALTPVLRAGHAARTIVEVCREGGFDVVVLGHSAHSGAWATILGTTTEKVSRYAPCSTLIVR